MNRLEATSKLIIIILVLLLASTLHCLALAENLDPIQIVKDYRSHMTPIGKYDQAAKWIGTKVVMKVGTLVPLIADPGIYNYDYIVVFPDYQKGDITISHNVLPEEISRIQAAGKSVDEVIGIPFLREEYHLPIAFFPEGIELKKRGIGSPH